MAILPDIAVLVSTFDRSSHLARSLLSIALQRGVSSRMEVVVTDDGAPHLSRPVVEEFARRVRFPVRYTTHSHDGFRLSQCRNEGAAVSRAPYLLFTDGDCLLPPDHVASHLECRRPGQAVVGDCVRLDREATERLTRREVLSGAYLDWVAPRERRRMAWKSLRAHWYHLLRCRMRPRMSGNNIGVWRSDYEQINGFDENFVGWGLEDRDLQLRLSRLGLRFKPILARTTTVHLWHPPAPTFVRNNVGTKNLDYYRREEIPTRCARGLQERIEAGAASLRDELVRMESRADAEFDHDEAACLIPFAASPRRDDVAKAA
jgi:glycosyltransferase involved in cell wall biosynthesis